jgi:hypothetical protein
VPSFPRHILFGAAPTIAGRSRQRPCDTHHGPQCPRLRHDPYSRQRLCLSHDPKSTAASTQESSTQERNVDIRHASRREQCSKARFYVRASNSGSLAIFAAIRRASSRVSQLGLRIVCPAHPRNKGKPISARRARLLCRERTRECLARRRDCFSAGPGEGRREAAFGELCHGHECCSRRSKAGGFMNRLLIIGLLVMFTLPL